MLSPESLNRTVTAFFIRSDSIPRNPARLILVSGIICAPILERRLTAESRYATNLALLILPARRSFHSGLSFRPGHHPGPNRFSKSFSDSLSPPMAHLIAKIKFKLDRQPNGAQPIEAPNCPFGPETEIRLSQVAG